MATSIPIAGSAAPVATATPIASAATATATAPNATAASAAANVSNLIAYPLKAVQQIFNSLPPQVARLPPHHYPVASATTPGVRKDWNVPALFSKALGLDSPANVNKDEHDREMYHGVYAMIDTATRTQSLKPGKYMDIAPAGDTPTSVIDRDQSQIAFDRQPFFCVSAPGEANWVHDFTRAASAAATASVPILDSKQSAASTATATATAASNPAAGATAAAVPAAKKRDAASIMTDDELKGGSAPPTATAATAAAAVAQPIASAAPTATVPIAAAAAPANAATVTVAGDDDDMTDGGDAGGSRKKKSKASAAADAAAAAIAAVTGGSAASASSAADAARARTVAVLNSAVSTSITPYSLSRAPVRRCIVKTYDEQKLKIGDYVEVIGVLSMDPEIGAGDDGDDDEPGDGFDDDVSQAPASLVPRLHAIVILELPASFPLYPNVGTVKQQSFVQKAFAELGGLEKVRRELIAYFTTVLNGDDLAAELLLLHMLSRVQSRINEKCVGKLALNIYGIPEAATAAAATAAAPRFADRVYRLHELVLPRTELIRLSPAALNESRFGPVKDYNRNCLPENVLQSVTGTSLILDETVLGPCTLADTGVRNLRALKMLIDESKLEYDFKWSESAFPVDTRLLTLSTTKSLLSADISLKLVAGGGAKSAAAAPSPAAVPSAAQVWSWRRYFALLSHFSFHLPPQVAAYIEHEFIASRQASKNAGTPVTENETTLDQKLTLARVLSVSYMEEQLNGNRWKEASTLFARITARSPAAATATATTAASPSAAKAALSN